MEYTPELGIAAPELGWVPSPTFILRRAEILRTISNWQPGSALEMGCGSGATCHELSQRGYTCTGVESSADARDIAVQITSETSAVITSTLPDSSTQFEYLFSFEVLEHIENDLEALTTWLKHLQPGGTCLFSVPAHSNRWNVTDVLAGHYRRYDKQDVMELAKKCGLESIEISTYGWPASRLIEHVRKWVRTLQLKNEGIDAKSISIGHKELTGQSGIERSTEMKLYPVYGSWVGRKIMMFLASVQIPFTKTNLGISYMVQAKKADD